MPGIPTGIPTASQRHPNRLMVLLEKIGGPSVTGDKLAFGRPPLAGGL